MKKWYKSTAVWGSVLLFVGGGLEALGVTGALEVVRQIAVVFGIPLTAFGIRRALG